METICQEIGVPRKQIRETKRADRFIVIVHKSWLKCLLQQNTIAKFPTHSGFDEWPSNEESIGRDWSLTYFMTYKKYTHKVIPLPSCRKEPNDSESILNFAQLLQNISASNHRNLWKQAYGKYSKQQTKVPTKESISKNERNTVNLVPYDTVLLEAIMRTYGCNVIHVKIDKMKPMDDARFDKKRSAEAYGRFEPHVNMYPITSVIETSTHYVVVYSNFIENTLSDCVTYSPAIMDKSHNKPLFMIYQLLQLMKTLHERGLLLGNIGLDDIFLTDSLWLQVMPQINLNILQSAESQPDATTEHGAVRKTAINMPLVNHLSYSLKDYCEMWCNGQISNFDYLTILNNLSGRRPGDPSFHHIMPWVTDFVSRNGMNWRDLSKSKYRLNKGDVQLDLMFVPSSGATGTMVPHHVSDVLSEITYYVYMARRTPKSVLCKHVRPIWVPAEYPGSISRLYDWTPDECIPEFFTDPLVFKSIHEDLPDLEVPTWSSCPEDFITKHREALESQCVSERLHHWIDLNFGFKLSGNAAIKSKNVYLSMVDNHETLCKRGIVQLFNHPHPPKQYQTVWTSKTPPRIYSQNEMRRRLTRSTEDLSNKYRSDAELSAQMAQNSITESPSRVSLRSSSKNRTHSPNMSEEAIAANIERSMSMHSNVQRNSFTQIFLPKDYNPVAAIAAVENMEIFLSKTFYNNVCNENFPRKTINYPTSKATTSNDEGVNAFTNRIFSEQFEENLMKDTKRLHNLNHKNLFVQNSTRNYKQVIADHRYRELQVLACIIVEIFLANKMRPLGVGAMQTLDERIEACKNVLKVDFDLLPKCVRYPVKLLFSFGDSTDSVITDLGLPKPSPNQMLQPFLSNFLFPFPYGYLNVYYLLKSLHQYEAASQLLDIYTYFSCDGTNCRRFDALDKQRIQYKRKIAECKVMACTAQIERLLVPHGYEQFNLVDLILPHIIDLLSTESTSILTAWFLFDSIAVALGPNKTKLHLLEPILRLYDSDNDERVAFLNSNYDSSMKFTSGSTFKSRKTIKLYHHSFLLRLIVRFGLRCFLNNFVPPLIEAIGGYGEPPNHSVYHYHDNNSNGATTTKTTNKNLKMCNESSYENAEDFSKKPTETDEMFTFENESDDIQKQTIPTNLTDSSDNDADTISRIIDNFDMNVTNESLLDLQLNHSNAMEATEEQIESQSGVSGVSYEENQLTSSSAEQGSTIDNSGNLTSPTIPIPSSSKRNLLNIDCEIGSKKSTEDADLLESSMSQKQNGEKSTRFSTTTSSTATGTTTKSVDWTDQQTQHQISDMSAESLIWLSHRLGPVLTARHLTRNLLKMLTLCYVGQENLLPDFANDENTKSLHDNLLVFTIADGRVAGDRNAVKVLECLTSITAVFGDHFILLQYFPHVTELIVLCKKRITSSLEGGLISSLQLLKYLVPCLSDTVIMDQLHDTILKSIIHPIIRFIGSTQFLMPNGFLARSVLARKLLDAIYVLAVRIGPEMTKKHLCVPALQRFFLIFDKAHGISDNFSFESNEDSRNSPTFEDQNFVEIRRDGGTKEWSVKGSPIQIIHARSKDDGKSDIITPPKLNSDQEPNESTAATCRERALEEIKEVFTPQLAHVSYVPFLKYLGDHVMRQFVKNLPLLLTLCHEFEQPEYASLGYSNYRKTDSGNAASNDDQTDGNGLYSSSFGTAMIGNRIELQKENEIGPMELLDLVAHKYDQINTTRHLRGNWLAYWEHEIGRPEKSIHFNFKQIKLQTFAGHANSVRSLRCLDNENSFMSASKDKTVKLWSLRSEGDGSKVSSCQFTYTNHRKSVHSLVFLESLRLAVSCDSSVHIWDPFVGGDIGILESHKLAPVSIVKTYPAPSSLILAGTAESTVKIIDARTFSYVNEWKFSLNQTNGSVRCLAMSPSGSWVAVGLSSGQLILCDGRTGMIIASWKATDGELLQLSAVNEEQLISTSLDHSICVWSARDGSLLYYMKSPNEPVHCLQNNEHELIFGTPANRIGVYANVSPDSTYSITKLRTETFKGVLTSLAVLPLNRMMLVGGDSGNISLLC